jgi:hypothetical protein
MAVSSGFDKFDPRRMTQPVSWFPRIFNPVFEESMTALRVGKGLSKGPSKGPGKGRGRANPRPLLSSSSFMSE